MRFFFFKKKFLILDIVVKFKMRCLFKMPHSELSNTVMYTHYTLYVNHRVKRILLNLQAMDYIISLKSVWIGFCISNKKN